MGGIFIEKEPIPSHSEPIDLGPGCAQVPRAQHKGWPATMLVWSFFPEAELSPSSLFRKPRSGVPRDMNDRVNLVFGRAGEKRLSTARAGNRRFWRLSVPRAHTKSPYRTDFHGETLRNAKGA